MRHFSPIGVGLGDAQQRVGATSVAGWGGALSSGMGWARRFSEEDPGFPAGYSGSSIGEQQMCSRHR
ncbi:hypothetical protein SAMN05216207_10632 [Pseudonocardia ammonioxydans]|uniref:Uncharacterized protein n=1 Tax=Pseudonocardia ammonioxydans TaxID=260086 RepID=A0A1I5HDN8_PSUAM|nr:hypothetical protein SAMN05216207_10632 [Pseudonocardia ammonioxydans]